LTFWVGVGVVPNEEFDITVEDEDSNREECGNVQALYPEENRERGNA